MVQLENSPVTQSLLVLIVLLCVNLEGLARHISLFSHLMLARVKLTGEQWMGMILIKKRMEDLIHLMEVKLIVSKWQMKKEYD